MKNKLLLFFLIFLNFQIAHSKDLLIQSKNISIDRKHKFNFRNEVFVKTDENHTIESDYAEYDKKNGIIKFKEKVKMIDNKKYSHYK